MPQLRERFLKRRGGRPATPSAVLDAIIAAFEAGATSVDKVAALPGMPSGVTIRNLYKADPVFRARLEPYWRPATHTPLKFEQADYLRAVEARAGGLAKTKLAAAGLPSEAALRTAAKRDPVIAQALSSFRQDRTDARLSRYKAAVTRLEGKRRSDLTFPD